MIKIYHNVTNTLNIILFLYIIQNFSPSTNIYLFIFYYISNVFMFSDVPPVKQVYNPFAIERPHATPSMLERQGSFRGFTQLNQASPFKRQLSLRVNDLPSNLERTRSHSLEPTDLSRMPSALSHIVPLKPPGECLWPYFVSFSLVILSDNH